MEEENSNFESLKEQLLEGKKQGNAVQEQRTNEVSVLTEAGDSEEVRGGRSQDAQAGYSESSENTEKAKETGLDDKTIIKFMADKKPMELTLGELKERAAGDIAVKNRMQSLAEEKKRVRGALTTFSKLASSDPLRALEEIAPYINEIDSDFTYDRFMSDLARQVEQYAQMDVHELKAKRLQDKLDSTEEKLSEKEYENSVIGKAEEIRENFGIEESQFESYVEWVMKSPELMEGCENDMDILEHVSSFAEEVQVQQAAYEVISSILPKCATDDPLVFEISSVIRSNPDFDEDDIKDIVHGLMKNRLRDQKGGQKQSRAKTVNPQELEAAGASSYEILEAQLLQEKEQKKLQPTR